ncbi:MAG TPA: GNAT family N-acetyltransferase [Rectinemataceae bacterium]|nr:GNAT family N-acetyltransferase [Rectinemataceae bacterium]
MNESSSTGLSRVRTAPRACASLDPSEKSAVAALLEACSTVDGGALLSMEKALNFDRDMPNWFLSEERGEILGLVSVFAPRRDEAELSAFVHPSHRRKGIGALLLAELERSLASYGFADELLVCDRGPDAATAPGASAGAAFARALGSRLDFTEYSMTYDPEIARGLAAARRGSRKPAPAGLVLADFGAGGGASIEPERLDELVRLRMEAFGDSQEDAQSMQRAALASPCRRAHVALLDGSIVAACSLAFEGGEVSLNGIGVAPAHRGKGIARELIEWSIARLAGTGLRVTLEVESMNERAFGLYSSLGFVVTRAVDYYRRPFPKTGADGNR